MTRKKRIAYLVGAVLLFLYGGYGILRDDMFVPSVWYGGIHAAGTAAWVFFAALLSAAISMATIALSTDVNNQRATFNQFIIYGAGALCIIFLVIGGYYTKP